MYSRVRPLGFYPDSTAGWVGFCLGFAQELLEFQEAWASTRGFNEISVKSMNKLPSMLRFLIKNGYRIYNVDSFGDSEQERILFVKELR